MPVYVRICMCVHVFVYACECTCMCMNVWTCLCKHVPYSRRHDDIHQCLAMPENCKIMQQLAIINSVAKIDASGSSDSTYEAVEEQAARGLVQVRWWIGVSRSAESGVWCLLGLASAGVLDGFMRLRMTLPGLTEILALPFNATRSLNAIKTGAMLCARPHGNAQDEFNIAERDDLSSCPREKGPWQHWAKTAKLKQRFGRSC